MSSEFSPRIKAKMDGAYEVYDIETTTDLKCVYLVGWYNGEEHLRWESLPLPPEHEHSAISQFARWYLARSKTPPIYAHNGGNFDHIYLLRWLLRTIPTAKIEIVPTQSSILLMTVRIGKRKYEFRDSMRLMPAGLDDISKTLLGSGKMTGIDYETLHQDPRRYEYLERDCVDLYRCIGKFREVIVEHLHGGIGLTAAATAIETLRTGYLSRSISGLNESREAFVRLGYYGGRTEVFNTGGQFYGPNFLKCYDINSMYVWALSQPLPCDFLTETKGRILPSTEGFLECMVNTIHVDRVASEYPVLPFRHEGKLLFPLGRFSGVWTTIEIKEALAHGYTIERIGRGVWFRTSVVFRNYVETLYKLRDKSKPGYSPVMSTIAKLLGNATYGKFGTNRDREKIHVQPSMHDILENHMQPLQGPLEVPVYVENIQCDASYILPHLAGWVTSLSRLKLLSYIYRCAPNPVYYCDTDSVYSVAPLSTGNGLGEMKVEYADIKKAEFIAPKVYRLTHNDNSITTRAKGFAYFGRKLFGDFNSLASGTRIECAAMSKFRTVLRGDFGLIIRQKHLLREGAKRIFNSDGTSRPMVIEE